MADLISTLDSLKIDDTPPPPPSTEIPPLTLTHTELNAVKEVRMKLIEEGMSPSSIDPLMCSLTTINQKLRIDDSVKKYRKFVEGLSTFGITDFSKDVWKGFSDYDTTLRPLFSSYSVCGTHKKRSIFWINGGSPVTVDKERDAVRAGIMYFTAIHADAHSLREGIAFVIDVGNQTGERIGNEKKMQQVWQSFPLRPQRILISGAGMVKRIFINGLVRFAALFSKAKVLERIRFVTMDDVIQELGAEVVPKYRSEKGKDGDIADWVKARLKVFPPPKIE